MGDSEAQGTLTYEKNLKSKISCQTPFKAVLRIRIRIDRRPVWQAGGSGSAS